MPMSRQNRFMPATKLSAIAAPMPFAQKPSILRSSSAFAAVTPKLTPAPTAPGTGAMLTRSRSRSRPASTKRRRRPTSTHGAAPLRERRQRCMGGAADEIDGAVAQRRVALVDGVDQLERDVEALLAEQAELDRRDGGEIRVRDHVRHGELHGRVPTVSRVPVGWAKSRVAVSTRGQ